MTEDPRYCDCVGSTVAKPWFHHPDCHRWAPPPAGPGSTPETRAAILAKIRADLARRRHTRQEHKP